jgi:hypothetical protein
MREVAGDARARRIGDVVDLGVGGLAGLVHGPAD